MYLTQYFLFCIVLLLCLGAVISFSLFVIKPMQTRWAVIRARKIVATGELPGRWHFRNIYRMLATAHNDLEAAKLWQELDRMK
jgi:regulator of protease activity HflC (stomatin/prohibitin superfamily)